jgi:hypothetical protein
MLYTQGAAMEPTALPRFTVQSVLYSQWAYWCSLIMAALSVAYLPAGSLRSLVMLTPVLTTLLCVSVTCWIYKGCDEYLRLRLLRTVVITAVVVSLATLLYFFMELGGFPRLSMLWVNLLGWSTLNAQMLFVVLRSR